MESEKILQALDALLTALAILQKQAELSDEEIAIRKVEAERRSDELLGQLR